MVDDSASKDLDTSLKFYGFNSMEVGKVIGAEPIKVQINPPNCYTNFPNTPLLPAAKEGLKPAVKAFCPPLFSSLVALTTLVLPVKKPNEQH